MIEYGTGFLFFKLLPFWILKMGSSIVGNSNENKTQTNTYQLPGSATLLWIFLLFLCHSIGRKVEISKHISLFPVLSYITLDIEWADKYALFKQFMQNLLKLLLIPFFIPTVRVRGGPSIWLYLAQNWLKNQFFKTKWLIFGQY